MDAIIPILLLLGLTLAFALHRRKRAASLRSSEPPVTAPGSIERLLQTANHTLSSLPGIIESQVKEEPSALLEANIIRYLAAQLQKAVLQSGAGAECGRLLVATDGMLYFRRLLQIGKVRRVTSAAGIEGVAGGSDAIDVVAIPILTGELSVAKDFVEQLLLPSRSTSFWNEYVRALAALLARSTYEAKPPSRSQGLEKHWVLYLQLIEAIAREQDVAPAVEAINVSFQRYGRDKRIWQFGNIDPSGNSPIEWDCRLAYILEGARLAGFKARSVSSQIG